MHRGNPAIKRGWLRTVLYFLALILTMILFGIPAVLLIIRLTGRSFIPSVLFEKDNIHLFILYQLVILSGVTALTFVFRKYIDGLDLTSLGFHSRGAGKDTFTGLLAGFACIAAGFAILLTSGLLVMEGFSPDLNYLTGSLILCLLISWLEEISFRAYILNNLMDSFHPFIALMISSFLFALFHLFNDGMTFLTFLNLFLAGILLGIVFIYTKTIWFAMSLHFSWNFFQGPVFGFRVSGTEMHGLFKHRPEGPVHFTGGEFGFEGSLICSLLIILLIILIYRSYNMEGKRTFDKLNQIF